VPFRAIAFAADDQIVGIVDDPGAEMLLQARFLPPQAARMSVNSCHDPDACSMR